ncbi:MAG TPA: hypothetical protein VNR61_20600 [Niallia sp.]|nr:hypothetical protein [Niallia sp.]
MLIQIFIMLLIIGGLFLAVKGHFVQQHAYFRLGSTLVDKEWLEEEYENVLTPEEQRLFLTSLSGIRMKIVGALLVFIPLSILILLHI